MFEIPDLIDQLEQLREESVSRATPGHNAHCRDQVDALTQVIALIEASDEDRWRDRWTETPPTDTEILVEYQREGFKEYQVAIYQDGTTTPDESRWEWLTLEQSSRKRPRPIAEGFWAFNWTSDGRIVGRELCERILRWRFLPEE